MNASYETNGEKEGVNRSLEYISNIHAVTVVLLVLFSYFATNSNSSTPLGYIPILGFTAGYFIADLLALPDWWKSYKESLPYIAHHLGYLLSLPLFIYCDNIKWLVFLIVAYEISTPFVNYRKRMRREYGRESHFHKQSAFLMYIVFFMVRIVTIPFILFNIKKNYGEYNRCSKMLVYVLPIYIFLNIYWFSIMTKIFMKQILL